MDWRTYLTTRQAATLPPTAEDVIPIFQTDTVAKMRYADLVGELRAGKNRIINGNFDVWQRGTTLNSGTGRRYLTDRFFTDSVGSTYTVSQQPFALGQTDVPDNPKFFHRVVVTSVADAVNYVDTSQNIESVRTCAGKTVTISFWARADGDKTLSVELVQSFGTGGAPSAAIYGIGMTACALTVNWQKFTVTMDVPSIAGKTLGSNGDSFLALSFFYDAGAGLAKSVGQQSGTFDIAQVQLEEGPIATQFERRHISEEIRLCQRYYTYHSNLNGTLNGRFGVGVAISSTHANILVAFPISYFRNIPAIVIEGGFQLSTGITAYAATNIDWNLGTSTDYAYSLDVIVADGLTVGALVFLEVANGGAAKIKYDAEI